MFYQQVPYEKTRDMEPISIAEKFTLFSEAWSPKVIGELNGQHVKLARIEGEFEWHHHEHEDELFLVIEGEMVMHYRDREVALASGELVIVPRGVEHKPASPGGAQILLFEPVSTLNTGNVTSERTVESPEWI
jgi:mannose-6-phosphate isomerase-like protein (cupin superfamily)